LHINPTNSMNYQNVPEQSYLIISSMSIEKREPEKRKLNTRDVS